MTTAVVPHSEACSIRPPLVRFTPEGELKSMGCGQIILSTREVYYLTNPEWMQIFQIFEQ
jgi:hypothetical protein